MATIYAEVMNIIQVKIETLIVSHVITETTNIVQLEATIFKLT